MQGATAECSRVNFKARLNIETEQARHEHVSDEYKDQYVIDISPSSPLMKVRETTTEGFSN